MGSMKYTEFIGADAPGGLLRYGMLDNIRVARNQDDGEYIFYNAYKRDVMTLRKMYQNTCRLLNIRMVLDSTWSDDAVDALKMLVVDLGPYLTVRGKVQHGGVKTALSSSVLRSPGIRRCPLVLMKKGAHVRNRPAAVASVASVRGRWQQR